MTLYDFVKRLHIQSATVLFGAGLGTAWFMWQAHRSGDVATVAATARTVVQADRLFTLPGVVIQLLSGLWLIHIGGYSVAESWLLWTCLLYVVAGACWLPVVWLQIRMCDLTSSARVEGSPLPAAYHRDARAWFLLGWLAFAAVIVIVYLMVAKP